MAQGFDFGQNWKDFSASKLNSATVLEAVRSLQELIGAEALRERSFLDVGCGSGLFSIAAAQCGAARVVGFDVNAKAVEVSQDNASRLTGDSDQHTAPRFCLGSVLDTTFLAKLGTFDIVYAWGVLHHTGALWQAIRNVSGLVEHENGTLALAIYNHHWTAPAWGAIKRTYNRSPAAVQGLLKYAFGGLIYVATWVTARQNPMSKTRGMDFWYDVVDWLGGYPYEYAHAPDVVGRVQPLGFGVERINKPRVPTGCNEFVFRRSVDSKCL